MRYSMSLGSRKSKKLGANRHDPRDSVASLGSDFGEAGMIFSTYDNNNNIGFRRPSASANTNALLNDLNAFNSAGNYDDEFYEDDDDVDGAFGAFGGPFGGGGGNPFSAGSPITPLNDENEDDESEIKAPSNEEVVADLNDISTNPSIVTFNMSNNTSADSPVKTLDSQGKQASLRYIANLGNDNQDSTTDLMDNNTNNTNTESGTDDENSKPTKQFKINIISAD